VIHVTPFVNLLDGRQSVSERVVRIIVFGWHDEAAFTINEPDLAIEGDDGATLAETSRIIKAGLNDPLAGTVDKAPFTTNLYRGTPVEETPSIVKARFDSELTSRVYKTPFVTELYGGSVTEKTLHVVKAGLDNELAGTVDVAPSAAQADRSQSVLKTQRPIELGRNDDWAILAKGLIVRKEFNDCFVFRIPAAGADIGVEVRTMLVAIGPSLISMSHVDVPRKRDRIRGSIVFLQVFKIEQPTFEWFHGLMLILDNECRCAS
jgi:hypothetical protein